METPFKSERIIFVSLNPLGLFRSQLTFRTMHWVTFLSSRWQSMVHGAAACDEQQLTPVGTAHPTH